MIAWFMSFYKPGVTEEDEPEPKGEDLQFLIQEELESVSDDAFSWDGVDSSSEEEIDSSSGDDPMGGKPFRFLGSSEEDSEEKSSGAWWSEQRLRVRGWQQRLRQRQRRRRRRQRGCAGPKPQAP